nr:ubiquitin-conjugating enzyme E2 U isoform X4 [Microcebus murinus]
MHCRAYLLLERDFQEFKMNDFEGIIVVPVSEDLMKWEAEIRGLQNTISHELVFQLTMDFTTEYSYVPPVVKFKPIPFHPNVNPQTGRPCIDFLDNPSKWNERYTLSSILLALQVMLSNPVPENPVNFEAAQILMKDKSLYRTITLKLFKEPSQSKDDSQNLPEEPQKVLEDPNFIGQYYKWRKMDLQYPKEWKLRFGALKSRFARKDGMPHRASHSTERGHLCPTPGLRALASGWVYFGGYHQLLEAALCSLPCGLPQHGFFIQPAAEVFTASLMARWSLIQSPLVESELLEGRGCSPPNLP